MEKLRLLIVLLLSALSCLGNAANVDTTAMPRLPIDVSQKTLHRLEKKYASLEKRMTRNAQKSLVRLHKTEQKLQGYVKQADSAALRQRIEKYISLLQNPVKKIKVSSINEYIPSLDSLSTSLKFLDIGGPLKDQIASLQNGLQAVSEIGRFIRERSQSYKAQLESLGQIKELRAISKQAYYYKQQVAEYKALLKDPDKLAGKILSVARNTGAFEDFFRKNSLLAQLFPMPQGYGSAQALQGLQTRAAVQQQLAQQIGVGGGAGINPQQYLEQQVAQAQAMLNTLKDKINKAGGGNSDFDIPDFKPNTQRTKTFWQRIEYGLNIQSQRPNGLLPVTSDIAFTLGYKLNDKSSIGFGAGYKLGWGKNFSNIRFTSEGVSLRSYLDIKIKGGIWASGGFEYNYQQSFRSIEALKDMDAWQKSGLIGLTKKYRIGKKEGKLQLLWDMLSYSQVPGATPLKFRLGYTL